MKFIVTLLWRDVGRDEVVSHSVGGIRQGGIKYHEGSGVHALPERLDTLACLESQ